MYIEKVDPRLRMTNDLEYANFSLREQANLLDNAHDAISVRDLENRIIYWNKGAERLYGWTSDEVVGKKVEDLLFIEGSQQPVNAFRKMLENGEWSGEFEQINKNNEKINVESHWILNYDDQGNPRSIFALSTDITDRKKNEDELRKASYYARSLIEASLDPLVTISRDGKITDVNEATEQVTGYSRDELIGSDFSDYFSEPEKAREGYKNVFTNGFVKDYPLAIHHKSGNITDVLYNATVYNDEAGEIQGVFAAARDVTARNESDEKVRQQAELLDNAREAITLRDLDNRIIYWNKGSERVYGWKAEEVMGKIAHEVFFKEPSPQPLEALKIVKEKGEWNGEMQHVNKNGDEIIVDTRWTLMYDREGNPESILVINSDITEKKKLESQLYRAQRIESIGTLAGGMAHDLNNILTPILLSVEIIKEKLPCIENRDLIEMLEKNIKRGADLVQKVLSFARGVEGERRPIQLTRIINDLTKTIGETFPRSINISKKINPDLWQISGDATQCHQVLMNLCVNARDAMPRGGTLTISAENFIVDESFARMSIGSTVGPHVVISVIDTGIGMPSEVIDRIFEPFFTTKKLGEGTGLGLSTALAIVKSHGGFIHVYSEVDKGSVFKVYFPAISTAGSIEVEGQANEMLQGNGELILIVDDEEMIRKMVSIMLEENGYRSIVASDGSEAVTLFARHKNEVNLAIVDLMMPVMDGKACIKALRKLDSNIKIIAASGLAQQNKRVDVINSINAFLMKPFSTQMLLSTIQSTLSTKW